MRTRREEDDEGGGIRGREEDDEAGGVRGTRREEDDGAGRGERRLGGKRRRPLLALSGPMWPTPTLARDRGHPKGVPLGAPRFSSKNSLWGPPDFIQKLPPGAGRVSSKNSPLEAAE